MLPHGITYFVFVAILLAAAGGPFGSARVRQIVLLSASYFFYWTWSPDFLALLIASSVLNFVWCGLIRSSPRGGRVLTLGVTINVTLLLAYKTTGLVELVGISFYTFQAISAQIDTWRGFRDQPTLIEFGLYMAFWPTILSGPICRLPEMLPQYRTLSRTDSGNLREGSRRIIVGFFQKLVVAETLARGIGPSGGVVGLAQQPPVALGGFDAWVLAIGTGLFIYFDFCGYSNIVIGSGRLFGLELRENFNRPFLAESPAEFWNRWHMSLSSWIRDYVFFPLAAAGRSRKWSYFVLVVSMVLFGLWHDIRIHFFLWGLYQGLLLAGHRRLSLSWARLTPTGGAIVTFMLISAGWPLFSGAGSTSLYRVLLQPASYATVALAADVYALVGGTLGLYLLFQALRRRLEELPEASVWRERVWLAAPVYYATMALWIAVWSEQTSPFVYVRF